MNTNAAGNTKETPKRILHWNEKTVQTIKSLALWIDL